MRQPGVVEGEASTDMYSTAGETEAVTQHSFGFQSGCLWTRGPLLHEPPHMSRDTNESFQRRRRFFMSIHVRLHCVRR